MKLKIILLLPLLVFSSCVGGSETIPPLESEEVETETEFSMPEPVETEPCDGLEGEDELACLDDFYLTKATNSTDLALCTEIKNGDLKIDCLSKIYFEKAKEEKNPELCKQIPKEEMITDCIGQLGSRADGPELCNSLTAEEAEVCLLEYYTTEAIKKTSIAICESLENKQSQETCKNDFRFDQAVKAKDANKCKEITNKKKSLCVNVILQMQAR